MNFDNINNIILKPIVTEKSLMDQERGRYHFLVSLKANKDQISHAFEVIFGHKALGVNTFKVKGKTKTDWRHRRPIVKPDRKKAIVTIAKDKKIELLNLNKK